jgi:uncharacterized membrane protein (DUF373 family)
VSAQQSKNNSQAGEHFALSSIHFLDRAGSVIYALTGICFVITALLALVYTFWAFGVSIRGLHTFSMDQLPTRGAQAIIEFISGLLLVLIIVEMLGTVIHYLQKATDFLHAMIELGVNAAVILALGITLKLLGRLVEFDESI